MQWLHRSIRWIMVIGGLITVTMLQAVVAPEATFRATFGEPLGPSPAAHLVVRSWGLLIALVGALLVLGAFRPAVRRVALTMATASKFGFVGLVLAEGSRYLGFQAGIAVVVDSVLVLLFLAYLFTAPPSSGRMTGG